ncbi:MAG: hypothetical protein QNJ97_07235 [Myxococcota bacterium]|nr:hypothetical protein [Myxococcota bacterium]
MKPTYKVQSGNAQAQPKRASAPVFEIYPGSLRLEAPPVPDPEAYAPPLPDPGPAPPAMAGPSAPEALSYEAVSPPVMQPQQTPAPATFEAAGPSASANEAVTPAPESAAQPIGPWSPEWRDLPETLPDDAVPPGLVRRQRNIQQQPERDMFDPLPSVITVPFDDFEDDSFKRKGLLGRLFKRKW